MKEPKTLYSLDEVVLIPSPVSYIEHRAQCDCFDENEKLPLFIAPMCCLVDQNNYEKFEKLNFNVIIPRTVPIKERLALMDRGKWVAMGLDEAEDHLLQTIRADWKDPFYVCIDIANGHQVRSVELCKRLKKHYPNIVLMVGNIANPAAYKIYSQAGADYVRIGIGSGHVCTTSVQTGIHYPMASLITECRRVREKILEMNIDTVCSEYYDGWKLPQPAKIVADGGFGYIDQIVKALALGADYVMLGRIAAGFPEACGEVIDGTREYYGMSTEKAQRLMHPEPDYVPKHTEGTVRYVPITGSTETWIKDFTHALRSSMSYCNALELGSYIGKVEWGLQSPVTFKAYIKS